ncbi:DUF6221 family protein [Kitasatospora sp. MBT63]
MFPSASWLTTLCCGVLAQSYTEHPDYREEWRPETPEPTEGP